MADVFIAYSARDGEWSKALAEHLKAEGYTVWWDATLLPGDLFLETIQKEISQARAVIVLWSENSAQSHWVRAEATFAFQQNKLLPFMLGDFVASGIPLPFGEMHTERLRTQEPAQFSRVVLGLARLLGQSASGAQVGIKDEARESQPLSNSPLVFVSHIDTDKPRIRVFVERLLERGLSVFVDKPAKLGLDKKWAGSPQLHYIRYFENYRSAISRALNQCGCVLVFWSFDSVETDRQIFWDEIEHGSANGFLVSTMIDNVVIGTKKLPKGFGFSQANIADLTSESALEGEFEWVIADINQIFADYGKKLKLRVDSAKE